MPEVATSPRSRASPRLETRREKGSTPNELNETKTRACVGRIVDLIIDLGPLPRVTTKPPLNFLVSFTSTEHTHAAEHIK